MKSMQVQFNCWKQTLKVQSNILNSWTHTHLPSLKMEWTPQLTTVTRVRWHEPNTQKNCMHGGSSTCPSISIILLSYACSLIHFITQCSGHTLFSNLWHNLIQCNHCSKCTFQEQYMIQSCILENTRLHKISHLKF